MNPQVRKGINPPQIKDTKGLGHKIPIQNIGAITAIAGTIASAGIGAVGIAAGEALLPGGLTGFSTADENILGSVIGSGVGAGIDSALGGGDVGHYVRVIGGVPGVVGRTASGRTRT